MIHVGKIASDKVGVIIETKKPNQQPEMITAENPNKKAFEHFDQEVFYVRWQIQWMELGIFDWINTLSKSEQKRKLAELSAISTGEIDFEESSIKRQLNEYQKQNQKNRTHGRN